MKRIIFVIAFLAALGSGYLGLTRPVVLAKVDSAYQRAVRSPVDPPAPDSLTGSGAIEAEAVAITAELGGRILELKVAEGDEVTIGQVLVELDKAELLAQQTQLAAALAAARANLALASAPARLADVDAAQAQLSQAEVAREGARLIWGQAAELADNPHQLAARANQAQARVTGAQRDLELAQVAFKRAEIQAEAASRDQSDNAGLAQSEAAQYQLQAARTGVVMAEVVLTGTKKQVDHLVRLRDRPLPLIAQANAAAAAYRGAEAAVLAAQANRAAVEAPPRAEDIAVARAQVLQAEAALAAVEVQLGKQTLTAPRAGLISRKLVEPGELAAAGTMLLELSDLDAIHLTVYLPETEIGRVKIGQQARISVDAYPGEPFAGTVSFIAHQAEFTPRNVQTQQERASLVFAVKIKLDNDDHRLKPGMPADAEILLTSWAGTVTPSLTRQARPTITPTATTTTTRVEPTPIILSTPTIAPTPTAPEARPLVQAEIITWGLNVRSGPGIDYPVVTTLSQGDVVPVIDRAPGGLWLRVQLPGDGQTGWISGSPTYVTLSKDHD